MTSRTILIIYILFFIMEFIVNAVLILLNIRESKKNRGSVPIWFRDYIDKQRYEKSTAYTIEKGFLTLLSDSVSSVVVLTVILTGSFGVLDETIRRTSMHPYLVGIIYFAVLSLFFYLVSLPFKIYSQFKLEEKYGFNRMTVKIFIFDQLKGLGVSAVLLIIVLSALFFFMDKSGRLWWILASAGIIGFQVVLSILYPLVIAPLFNKFSPLEEGELKETLEQMAERNDFSVKGIFVMDGSKRSAHSNAYFTGFGKVKRIVLFDTLIEKLTPPQLAGVLAHEIGHEKKHHLLKGLILSFFVTVFIFFILDWFMNYLPLYQAFGFHRASYHAILVIISFCSGPFTFFLTPLFTMWSRKHEYEADRYAVKITGNKDGLKDGLIVLAKENLTNLTPHPLYSFFHYSHPTIGERLRAIDTISLTAD